MQSPNVPDRLPTTLSDLVALQSLHITGNSTIPSTSIASLTESFAGTPSLVGEFPAALLSMPDLETLDIEYTSLTGPLSTVEFGRATGLKTLYLVNNQELGTSLPSLSGNSKLVTL